MSETSAQPYEAGSADASRRRKVVAIAGAGAVALIAVVYFVFLAGGGTSNQAAPIVKGHPRAAVVSSALGVASAQAPVVVPAAYNGPAGRNPFKPLATPPAAVASGSASPSASTSKSATPSASPSPSPTVILIPTPTPSRTASPSPTPTVTVTATPSPTGLPTAGSAITLTLVSVDSTAGTADVTVAQGTTTTPYNGLKPGQVFGAYFKLVSILSSDPANPPVKYGADFEYGDQFVQLGTGEWSQFG